jgi:nicotinamide mononucleotide transporter
MKMVLEFFAKNPYEVTSVLFGVVAVYLTVRENVWCWPLGLVNVGLSIVVFWQAKLYADMGLNAVYVVLCSYGWYEWLHGGANRGALPVSRSPRSTIGLLALLGTAGAGLLGLALARHTDASMPFWDSSTTSFSLVAQFMQTRKWFESWIVWIVVDVVYVGMYVYKSLYPMAGLYAVFLVLAVLGLREWKQSLTTSPRSALASTG